MKRVRPASRAPIIVGLALLWAVASGFSSSAMFETSANRGGGGGLLYTGSPTSHGMTCANCHQGNLRDKGLTLSSEPAGLFTEGYEPGVTYAVRIKLDKERKGLSRQGACTPGRGGCNSNSFVAEWLDEGGAPVGQVCVDGATIGPKGCESEVGESTFLLRQGGAIGGNSQRNPRICGPKVASDCVDIAAMTTAGKSQAEIGAALIAAVRGRVTWQFQWHVNRGQSRPVRFYVGVVDGDGGMTVDPFHNDYRGDVVIALTRTIRRKGQPEPTPLGGCDAGASWHQWGQRRRMSDAVWSLLLLGLTMSWVWRKRQCQQ